MTKQQQEEILESIFAKIKDIQLKKGNDYSSNTDRLSNFKLAGSICGLTPELNCLSLIATKVARLGVLISGEKTPDNESIIDSVDDLISYSILLNMILSEKNLELPKE